MLAKYYEGYISGNETLQAAALRWLRGEYTTKTEAREDLGVRRIIDDENFYDSLKLFAAFCVKAGYAGMLVNIDEMVVLSHRLPSSRARQTNYESLLTILNDCLQGGVRSLGFLMAGTDECLEDKRRGLYSYEALRSRLAENRFAGDGVVDFSGPGGAAAEPHAGRSVRAAAEHPPCSCLRRRAKYIVPDEALTAVLQKASETLGADYYKTPRDVIRSFVGLFNVLEQNPGKKWQDFLDQALARARETAFGRGGEFAGALPATPDNEDDLASFKL